MGTMRRETGKMRLPDRKEGRRNRPILLSIMSCWRSQKMQLLNKSRKLLEKKRLNNIPTKVGILRDLKDSRKLMIHCWTLRRDSSIISMEKRELKMVDHLAWAQIYLTSSTNVSRITNLRK